MNIKKRLANPMGLVVKDDPNNPEPKIGDRVEITDYSLFEPNKAIKISKLEEIRVVEVNPIVIGDDGDYHWEYIVLTDADAHSDLLPEMYKIVENN